VEKLQAIFANHYAELGVDLILAYNQSKLIPDCLCGVRGAHQYKFSEGKIKGF
jgi:hypothetical protein